MQLNDEVMFSLLPDISLVEYIFTTYYDQLREVYGYDVSDSHILQIIINSNNKANNATT